MLLLTLYIVNSLFKYINNIIIVHINSTMYGVGHRNDILF
jgi:hypothetical protein